MAIQKQGRGILVVLGAIAAAVVFVLFGVLKWDPRVPARTLATGQAEPQAGPGPTRAEPQAQAALSAAPVTPTPPKAEPTAPAAAPPRPSQSTEAVGAPSFDVVRVEPNGESVIAGRAAPGATIELLRNGQVHARAAADQSGLFAIVPPPLPPGSHQVTLQSIAPDGTRKRSHDSVTIIVSEGRNTRPLVALTAPDKPTVLLSNPEPPEQKTAQKAAPEPTAPPPQKQASVPAETAASSALSSASAPSSSAPSASPAPSAPAAAPAMPRPEVRIVSVETEDGGRLFVSGQAAPGATVRLYLNETFIAPGGAGGDGKVSFAIGRGVKPGDYRVRLDDVDPVSGGVKSRAEVAFNVPAPAVVAQSAPAQPAAAVPAGTAVAALAAPPTAPAPSPPQGEAQQAAPPPAASGAHNRTQVAAASPEARAFGPGTVMIPDINTAIVSRGDNLWRISRRIYGHGTRYTVIYGANQKQIRNPNLIYPGQVFVLPSTEATKGTP